MTDEAKKKIREKYNPQWFGLNGYSEYKAAEFGYQLGYEEAMREHGKVMQYSTPAAAVQNIQVVTMASESKEPKP